MTEQPEAELRPEPPRTRPSTLGGAAYILVALAATAGLGIVAFGPWRTGLTVIGSALVAGGVARMLLPDELAGMLKVRRKSLDVLLMVGLGSALIVLAQVVPDAAG